LEFKNIFCDWVSAFVTVDNLPSLGRVVWIDTDGVITRDTPKTQELHKTSSSTVFKIVQTGENQIWIDGNIGRFNRYDNLFGYSVADACSFIRDLLSSKGMTMLDVPRLTRVDVTQNLFVGDASISRFTHWAAGQRLGRHKPTLYESGVAWGLGSKHWSAKIYDKHLDLVRTKKKPLAEMIGRGIARKEITLRQRQLEKYGLENPADWTDNTEQIIMNCIFRQIDKGGASVEEIVDSNIPLRIENIIQSWRNGKDFVAAFRDGAISKATLYRMRKEVLMVSGLDILQPADLLRLPVKVHEIKPQILQVPDWYSDYTRMAA
jgi:hypothetical protein